MSYVYSWVKNLVCFYLFLTVVLHLLPKKNYQKYVRFFSGMLLTILVTSPILSLMGNEDLLKERVSQAGLFQELDNLKLDTAHLEDVQKEPYIREYERALELDVTRIAEEKELLVTEARVCLTEEYQVESIDVAAVLKEDGVVQKADFLELGREYPKVQELKQELMQFYQLDEDQIHIDIE